MGKKIKKQNAEQNKIKIPNKNLIDINYPVFCFKHLQIKPKGDHEFYTNFIIRLQKLCALGWNEIGKSHKHAYGVETLPIEQIKPAIPAFVTPDVKKLTVFRANGDNRPFLGIRNENLFHVIFIEEEFGDVYDHE